MTSTAFDDEDTAAVQGVLDAVSHAAARARTGSEGARREPVGTVEEEVADARAALERIETAVREAHRDLRALEMIRALRPVWDRVVAAARLPTGQQVLRVEELALRLVEIEKRDLYGWDLLDEAVKDITGTLVAAYDTPRTDREAARALAARRPDAHRAVRVFFVRLWPTRTPFDKPSRQSHARDPR